jgi:antitoxin ParD1/3/4
LSFHDRKRNYKGGTGLLEEREVKLNALRQALKEGEKSGFVDYSLKDLIKEMDEESSD